MCNCWPSFCGRTRLEEERRVWMWDSPWMQQLIMDLTVALCIVNIRIEADVEVSDRDPGFLLEEWWNAASALVRAKKM